MSSWESLCVSSSFFSIFSTYLLCVGLLLSVFCSPSFPLLPRFDLVHLFSFFFFCFLCILLSSTYLLISSFPLLGSSSFIGRLWPVSIYLCVASIALLSIVQPAGQFYPWPSIQLVIRLAVFVRRPCLSDGNHLAASRPCLGRASRQCVWAVLLATRLGRILGRTSRPRFLVYFGSCISAIFSRLGSALGHVSRSYTQPPYVFVRRLLAPTVGPLSGGPHITWWNLSNHCCATRSSCLSVMSRTYAIASCLL